MPISGIINYNYDMKNRKKKSGENKNKFKKMYPNNHEKFKEQQSQGPIFLALIEKTVL